MTGMMSCSELFAALTAYCPRCAAADPLLHAAEPRGLGDWVLVAVSVVILVAALTAALKLLWLPGEEGTQHVKRSVLDDSLPSPHPSAEVQRHE